MKGIGKQRNAQRLTQRFGSDRVGPAALQDDSGGMTEGRIALSPGVQLIVAERKHRAGDFGQGIGRFLGTRTGAGS
jgi:hypothetical protein